MGKSFFLGTDAELYAGSDNFSTMISATPTTFGLTAPLATSYAALNATYAAAYLAAKAPETRTKPKIIAKNEAKAALKAMASELAKLVDGTASVTDEQKSALGLSVRATPSPAGAPGTPNKFKASLSVSGALDIGWKCSNPAQGTIYQVWRRIGGGDGPFTYLGGVGSKKFLDSTIPAGSSQVTYQIQAVRSTAVGEWAQFNVNFGTASSGAMTAMVSETPVSPKMAA